MIEAYAFLAVFAAQLLIMSVLFPAWLITRIRRKSGGVAAERYAQLHSGIDFGRSVERFAFRFRAVNWLIAVVGLALFVWFYNYTQRPDWDDGPIEGLLGAYFLLQALPLLVLAWFQVRLKKKLLEHTTPDAKRKASLQRRGLFDFISPFTVVLAGLSYLVYVAFVIHIAQNPFPGFAGIAVNVGAFTLLYGLQGFIVYRLLYGKKVNRLETDADAVRTIGFGIRACVWVCIASVVNQSINFTLVLQDLQRWEPVAQSAFMVLCATLCMFVLPGPPLEVDAEGHGPRERPVRPQMR